MALFVCKNPSCEHQNIIKVLDKVTYIISDQGLRCPQKTCMICGQQMADITKFGGYPVEGVPKGSSNF